MLPLNLYSRDTTYLRKISQAIIPYQILISFRKFLNVLFIPDSPLICKPFLLLHPINQPIVHFILLKLPYFVSKMISFLPSMNEKSLLSSFWISLLLSILLTITYSSLAFPLFMVFQVLLLHYSFHIYHIAHSLSVLLQFPHHLLPFLLVCRKALYYARLCSPSIPLQFSSF